jgi:hypothetical protein
MYRPWLPMRLSAWARSRPPFSAWVRIATGVWLLVLTGLLYAYHRGGWWGPLLVAAAAVHFYLASQTLRSAGVKKG